MKGECQEAIIVKEAIRLIVFDLDGTLVDSKVDLANSVNHALGAFGSPPPSHPESKPCAMSRAILSGLSLDRYFVDVVGGDSLDCKKPHPDGLLHIMRTHGSSPGETLMVGDSGNDVLAGKKAGVATCGVTYGLGIEGFASLPPDFTIGRFSA